MVFSVACCEIVVTWCGGRKGLVSLGMHLQKRMKVSASKGERARDKKATAPSSCSRFSTQGWLEQVDALHRISFVGSHL